MSDRTPLEFYVRQLAAVLLFTLSAYSAAHTKDTTWQFLAVLFAANLLWDKTEFGSVQDWILSLWLLLFGTASFGGLALRDGSPDRWMHTGMAAGLAVETLVLITIRVRGAR